MPIREEEQRQVVAFLRQHGDVQTGKAAAAAARLTDKQAQALLAEVREKSAPLRALAKAALAAATPPSEAPAPALDAGNAELTT